MTLKSVFIAATTFACISTACAQDIKPQKTTEHYKNSIKAGVSLLLTPGPSDEDISTMPLKQFAFYYERQLSLNWYIGAGYNQWCGWNTSHRGLPSDVYLGFNDMIESYKMVDIYAFYKLPISGKKHLIYTGLGVITAFGKRTYMDDLFIYNSKKRIDFGLMPQITYDYLLLHNRISVGTDIKLRQFITLPYRQVDLAFHAGFNF